MKYVQSCISARHIADALWRFCELCLPRLFRIHLQHKQLDMPSHDYATSLPIFTVPSLFLAGCELLIHSLLFHIR